MDDRTSDSAAQHTPEVCQECGSPDVKHRSLLRGDGDHGGTIVLLCDDCHRARVAD
jgi:hypothetical protein